MLASVKSALKTPKAFAKKKKSKGQKQDDLVFSSSDWDTPTPPARASFTSTYTTRLTPKAGQKLKPKYSHGSKVGNYHVGGSSSQPTTPLRTTFDDSFNAKVDSTSFDGRGARTKRSGSLAKVKKLFTKRPLSDFEKRKLGKGEGSDIEQTEISTMSRPFYIKGLDDLTVVKDSETDRWTVEQERDSNYFTLDGSGLSSPGRHSAVNNRRKATLTNKRMSSIDAFASSPETNI
ncbi:uncharacterized protein LOC142335926 [Convolutriloba macropyga]|uniref:uncharacterized protein LOC142335926 n=1 Tax=Convolutriloba macropyga TaxID=536237 RepID=UPI003F5281A1